MIPPRRPITAPAPIQPDEIEVNRAAQEYGVARHVLGGHLVGGELKFRRVGSQLVVKRADVAAIAQHEREIVYRAQKDARRRGA